MTLLPDPHSSLLSGPRPIKAPDPAEFRAFGDTDRLRKFVYDDVHRAASSLAPFSNDQHTLRLTDVKYMDPERIGKHRRKQAVLSGETLGRRLRGTWELTDNATGGVLDRRDQVIARVPYVDSMGTITHRGTAYTINHQQRLRPGVYTRMKENGELEAHANIAPGKGVSHRYMLDPEKGVFKIKVHQAEMPLLPVLKALGASDRELHDAWGPELVHANMKVADSGVLKKLKDKLLPWKDRTDPDESSWHLKLRDAFGRMELEPEISRRTLGHPYARLDKDSILATTKKLLAVGRGEAETDDRDHPAYQTFVGPEDLIRERIERDHGRLQRKAFWKVSREGNLSKMPSGLMTPQIEQVLMGSGLAQSIEEINPLEVFDKQGRITRMGEGGLPSLDSVPESARSVQPGHYGFLDPIRTPESMRAGIDLNMARGAVKGRDGTVYAKFVNPKTGRQEWKSPRDLADSAIAFPGWERWPSRRVPVMKSGKITYVPKAEVEYSLPHMEDAFSPLGNLVPMKSMVKGQRVAMASRMTTQALPLANPEAPLVRGAVPGTGRARSFEEEYGKYAGAVHADRPGRITDFRDGTLHVRYDDGTRDEIELYRNFPFARKTLYHQTPVLEPGQAFKAGDLLAHSNYTDRTGATALGINARVAYVPWKGLNYEDAIAISESMAKRLTSEHAYQHDLEVTEKHRLGKRHYLGLFPAKFTRAMLDRLDEKGVIRPGQAVEYGDPLIVAAQERDRPQTKIHRQRQAGYDDASVTWKHHDPGVVTDVVWGKSGPTVMVKSTAAMQVGDKLCFDPETFLLTRRGWVPVAGIKLDDEIATLNSTTGELEYQAPTQLHHYQHDGPMFYMNTKHVNMLVTPNHRLWVARPGADYQAVRADTFHESAGEWQFKKDCTWRGEEQEQIVFPAYDAHNSHENRLAAAKMDDWVEFLGYYLAEGWCEYNPANNGYRVKIAQFRKSPAWAKIGDVLRRLDIRFAYNESDQRFEICSKWLYGVLFPLGDSYSKHVPEYVQALSARQLRLFFDAYMAGDGHEGACWEYGSSSERLAVDIQVICLKLGWCVTLKKNERTDNWQKSPHWRGRINRNHLRPWWKKSKLKAYPSNRQEMIAYSGDVYCVTVPNHVVYCKREDKTYWSHNSGRYG